MSVGDSVRLIGDCVCVALSPGLFSLLRQFDPLFACRVPPLLEVLEGGLNFFSKKQKQEKHFHSCCEEERGASLHKFDCVNLCVATLSFYCNVGFRCIDMNMDMDMNVPSQHSATSESEAQRRGKQLLAAAEAQEWSGVKYLIAAGADLNCANQKGRTALWLAVQKGREDVVKALVEAGAANTPDKDLTTPLILAVYREKLSIADTLVRFSARPIANIDSSMGNGCTALWMAAQNGRHDVVIALAEAGADVNEADATGTRPLSVAPTAAIATALVERGAHVDAVNKRGETALWLAARHGRGDVVTALVEKGADVNKVDASGLTPLVAAADKYMWAEVLALVRSNRLESIDAVNRAGQSTLWLAAWHGRANVVMALIENGADLNKADSAGLTPLVVAAEAKCWGVVLALVRSNRLANIDAVYCAGQSTLWLAAQRGNEDVVTALIEKGADVNKVDSFGLTPLVAAAEAKYWGVVLALVRSNRLANIDAVYCAGQSTLWLAAQRGNEDVVTALIEKGADVNKVDSFGLTPLVAAAEAKYWGVVLALVRSNRLANIDAVNREGRTALWLAAMYDCDEFAIEELIQAGADVNKDDNSGTAPLGVAATAAIASALLECGAHIHAVNKRGETALWLAARRGREDVVMALVEKGADVNQVDSSGLTPLVAAANADRWFVVLALVRSNRLENIDAVIRFGQSTLWLATNYGCIDVVKALIQAGADVNKADNSDTAPLSIVPAAKALSKHAYDEYLDKWTRFECTVLLLAAGADVSARDSEGKTACLHAAEAKSSVVYAMLAAGADLDAADEYGMTPRQWLAVHQANIDDEESESALADIARQWLALNQVTIDYERVESARCRISKARLDFVRYRAMGICIGLQSLRLNALQLCEILQHACGPVAHLIAFHQWWKIATTVKHFTN
jgi:ankyrin repeat protein